MATIEDEIFFCNLDVRFSPVIGASTGPEAADFAPARPATPPTPPPTLGGMGKIAIATVIPLTAKSKPVISHLQQARSVTNSAAMRSPDRSDCADAAFIARLQR